MMMIVGGLKKTSKEEVEGGGRQDKKPRKTSAVKFLWTTSCHIVDIPRSSEMREFYPAEIFWTHWELKEITIICLA